jgi:hypothetical protein
MVLIVIAGLNVTSEQEVRARKHGPRGASEQQFALESGRGPPSLRKQLQISAATFEERPHDLGLRSAFRRACEK